MTPEEQLALEAMAVRMRQVIGALAQVQGGLDVLAELFNALDLAEFDRIVAQQEDE